MRHRLAGVLPAFLIEGGLTQGACEYYLKELLLNVLRPRKVLLLDNFTVHRGERIELLAAQAVCQLHDLPSYSPNLNPIELKFSKLNAHLRMAAALTFSAVSQAIKAALNKVTLSDIQGLISTPSFPRQ